jgi:ligand-binding sensor domain-containing protein
MNNHKKLSLIFFMCLLIMLLVGCNTPEKPPQPGSSTPNRKSEKSSTVTIPVQKSTITPTPEPPSPVWNVITQPRSIYGIRDMTLGNDQSLWITGDIGVVQLNLETGDYLLFDYKNDMPGYSGSDILTDSQGGIWVVWDHSTYKGYGVSRFFAGKWFHYNISTGLANNNVNYMASAEDGKIWFSTSSGISCFTNGNWKTYTMAEGLPSNDTGAIAVGPDGVVWAHTTEGMASFDGSSWTVYDEEFFKRVIVNDIFFTRDGMVWFASTRNFSRFDGKEFIGSSPQEGAQSFDSFTETTDGTLWARGSSILNADRGIYAWKNNQWYYFLEETGLPTFGGNGLLATQDGALWLTTTRDGLIRITDWTFYNSGIATSAFQRFCTSGTGVVLQGHFSVSDLNAESCLNERSYYGSGLQLPDGRQIFYSHYGVFVLSPSGDYQVLSLPMPDPEPAFVIPAFDLYGDDDTLRLEYPNLFQFDGKEWQNLSEKNKLFESAQVIKTGPDGKVWVGSVYSLAAWDGKVWEHWSIDKGNGDYEDLDILKIAFYGKDVWVVDRLRGISKLIGSNLKNPQWEPLIAPKYFSDPQFFEIDSRGGLWVADYKGLPTYFDGTTWQTFSEDKYKKVIVTAMAIAQDDSLWVGFKDDLGYDWSKIEDLYDSYLMRFDGNNWCNPGIDLELPQTYVQQILFTSDGDAWVSYFDHGVVRFDPKGESGTPYNTSNVFFTSDQVGIMRLDDDGAIWFRLGDGFARYGLPFTETNGG